MEGLGLIYGSSGRTSIKLSPSVFEKDCGKAVNALAYVGVAGFNCVPVWIAGRLLAHSSVLC